MREKEQALNDDDIGDILYNKSNRNTKIILDDIEIEMKDTRSSKSSQTSRPSNVSNDDQKI